MTISRDKKQKTCWDGWFCITLPSGWVLDETGDATSIYNPKGVGAITVSMYSEKVRMDQESLALALRFADGIGITRSQVSVRRTGDDFSIIEFSENQNEHYWKIAAFHRAKQAVVMSYNSSIEEQERDAGDVDSIFGSFEWDLRA